MTSFSSKFLFLLLASLLFVGCVYDPFVKTSENPTQFPSSNSSSPVNQSNVNQVEEPQIDTSDWLTYENKEYGFSFRYPSESKLIENANSSPYPGISFLSNTSVDSTKKENWESITAVFAVTELDLITLTKKIEQSDTSGDITLAKVGPIQERTLNQFTVYQSSHATAIGIPTNFYYVPLKNNFALFIFYNGDKNDLNINIINTLRIEK